MDLRVGDRIMGRVTQLAHFGAFLDIGISDWSEIVLIPDISWWHISHPQDVLSPVRKLRL